MLIAAAVSVSLVGGATASSGAALPGPHVQRCQSTYALANGAAGLNTRAAQPHALAPAGYTYYSDSSLRLPPVLAPSGWRCHATIFGNGTVLIVVAARQPGKSIRLADLRRLSIPLVAFYNSSACMSCLFSITCGANATATQLFTPSPFGKCPQPRSRLQRM